MASLFLPHRRNKEHDAFSGIEPQAKRRTVEESSRLFEVFINHRGPDVKETVARQFYKSLKKLGIHAFLDSEEKELGDSFPSTIENAIHSASAQIAVFSKGYAKSPWCLAELVLMLQSKAKIFPVFYGVTPSDLRYIEKGKYAKAFAKYEEKKRYMEKLQEWKEALQTVSFITGHEISSNFNISDCQNIVSAVEKEVQRTKFLHVAKYPVELHKLVKDFESLCLDNLLEDFESQCRTNEGGEKKAQIVGIFGMGGVGKTTLAKELFNQKQFQYRRACFLFDVREAYANNSFPSLQLKLLKDLFRRDGPDFYCKEEGTSHIGNCIRRSKQLSFLIVVDDIDHVQQLDALLIMEMLKKSVDSLVIVTTRDVAVLVNTGITAAYNVKGMDRDNARELFCWHAFGQPHPANEYQNPVTSFLNVCGGLPLSLQVLGSHVRGRDEDYWSLELKKVKKTLPRDILQRLRISFDALDYEEQQIFMDLACFFVDKLKSISIQVWEASGWSAQHALETLKNKCLVQEIQDRYGVGAVNLRMHDHLRDLGREMANGLSRPRRLWRPHDLEYLKSKGSQNILSQIEGRYFHSILDNHTGYQITYFVGESDFSAERATTLLWLKVGYHLSMKEQATIPSWIPLQNLRCLVIHNLSLKSLWQSHVQAPTQLKELEMYNSSLQEFSDLSGMANSLEKILIDSCTRLQTVSVLSYFKKLVELNISNCFYLQELSVVHLSRLKKLILHNCHSLKTVLGISDLRMLVELNISGCLVYEQLSLVGLTSLKHITVDHCLKPKYFELVDCRNLKTISGNPNLEKVVSINIRDCPKLEMLPSLEGLNDLKTVTIDGCGKLNSFLLSQCQNLKRLMCKLDCPEKITIDRCEKLNCLQLFKCLNLKQVSISDCWFLENLSCFASQTCLEQITIVRCAKLQIITLPTTLVELTIEGCRELETVATICDQSECLELQELSSVARLSCLKQITIKTSDKLQTIQCIDELSALEILQLFDCPKLEDLSCFARQTCLEKITIVRCAKLQSITLPTTLAELRIEGCTELKTVATICDHSECLELQELSSVARLSSLKQITIKTCDNLQTIQCIDELSALEILQMFDCPKLEDLSCFARQTCLQKITVVRCEKLQNITLPTTLVELRIEGCRELKTVATICDHSECPELQELSSVARLSCLKQITIKTCDNLQTIQGIDELSALEILQLFDCPKLEDLSCFARQTCLQKITIVRCAKLQNITLPTKLVELRIEGCSELKTVATICDHRECLELQELSIVARMSCLKEITIVSCDKLQTIQGIDELHALKSMQLSCCSNGAIENYITMLKTVPSEFLFVMGRAADRALSNLNSHLFSDAITAIDEIGTRTSSKGIMSEVSRVIFCAVVVINNSWISPQMIRETLLTGSRSYSAGEHRRKVWQGEWVITIVTTDHDKIRSYSHKWERDLVGSGIIMKRYRKGLVKKGEEWKTEHVLHTIIQRLYHK